ncbi:MAG: Ig-like domain-containing protein [bacterium]
MRLRTFPAVVGIVVLSACGGSDGGTTPVRTISKVTVSGSNTALNAGQTTQLTAVASDASGATIANPGIVVWASSAATVATVDQSGRVTAVSGGSTTITADAAGVKGSFLIRVNLAGGV